MVNLGKGKQIQSVEQESLLISEELNFEDLAKESKFYKNPPKKITATDLFLGFWNMQKSGQNSLRNWSMEIGRLINGVVEKQSLNERLNERTIKMCELALEKALNQKKEKGQTKQIQQNAHLFNRILIRDSTTQNLPGHLNEIFPGNYNKYKKTAVLRIQACYDFSNHKWLQLELKSFRDNDQGAADCIYDVMEPNDLILQDLGYFTLAWLRQIVENQRFVITQYKSGTNLYTLENEQIDLLEILKKKREVDMKVLVGKKEKLGMRLVARKLPKSKAAKRIKSAKKDRQASTNHSGEYYELLKYEIYLTNVSKEKLNGKEVAKLYGLRWHIETLFKSWKSYANFKKMFKKEKMNEYRVKFTVYAMLIQFVYLMGKIYPIIRESINEFTYRPISIFKFMQEMLKSIDKILCLNDANELLQLSEFYAKNITYENHSKRTNTIDKYKYVKDL